MIRDLFHSSFVLSVHCHSVQGYIYCFQGGGVYYPILAIYYCLVCHQLEHPSMMIASFDWSSLVMAIIQDAVHASIEIQLFPLKRRGGKRFDPEKCYRAILTGDGDDYNEKV